MTVGTKSVLFGVHCFFIHPFLLAIAWWKLFGFPWDPRLWVAFFVHDLGYLGKPNMDGPEGEEHPWLGAKIMGALFDPRYPTRSDLANPFSKALNALFGHVTRYGSENWLSFTLYHSRYLAKRYGVQPSKLAIADKLVIAIESSWLYLPRAIASGEINDYYDQAVKCKPSDHADNPETFEALCKILAGGRAKDAWLWHEGVRQYMQIYVAKHRDGSPDTMTSATRGN